MSFITTMSIEKKGLAKQIMEIIQKFPESVSWKTNLLSLDDGNQILMQKAEFFFTFYKIAIIVCKKYNISDDLCRSQIIQAIESYLAESCGEGKLQDYRKLFFENIMEHVIYDPYYNKEFNLAPLIKLLAIFDLTKCENKCFVPFLEEKVKQIKESQNPIEHKNDLLITCLCENTINYTRNSYNLFVTEKQNKKLQEENSQLKERIIQKEKELDAKDKEIASLKQKELAIKQVISQSGPVQSRSVAFSTRQILPMNQIASTPVKQVAPPVRKVVAKNTKSIISKDEKKEQLENESRLDKFRKLVKQNKKVQDDFKQVASKKRDHDDSDDTEDDMESTPRKKMTINTLLN